MIGLDINVLVRYFVKDDPEQTRRAVGLIHALTPTEPGFVGLAVLVELIWVITRRYRMKRDAISQTLAILLASREIVVEQSDTVRAALQFYRSGNAGFADCLIAASAKAAGCSRTVTFDRIAARDAGMELVE
jgi:predicted nucleic-acid-binding protein